MNKWIRFSGILGLVVFGFGFFGALLIQRFDQPLLLIHMLLGILIILVWFFAYGLKNFGEAQAALKGRRARYGANAFLYGLVFLGFLILANWFAKKYDRRWDLTEQNVYSLTSQSVNVLKNLKKPLKLVAFKGTTQVDETSLQEIFDLYKYNSSNVSAEIIDPRAKPHLLDKYEMKAGNVVYLEYGVDDKKSVSRINDISEEAITNAIIKLTRGDAKKIYYVEGHAEPDIGSDAPQEMKQLASAIADEHLTLEGIVLSQKGSVPDDAAALILCSPKKNMLPEEKVLIENYVKEGGHLIMMTDPRTTNDVKELSDKFGIEVLDNVVIDQIQRLFAAPTLGAQPMVRDYTNHAITKNMTARDITIYNIASAVRPKANDSKEATYVELAKTGPTAWGESNIDKVFNQENAEAVFDNKDLPGPVPLIVTYEKKVAAPLDTPEKKDEEPKFEKTARVIVIGDSDWVLNANFQVYANRDFILNMINWVVGEEGGISVRPKSLRTSVTPISNQVFVYLLTFSFLVPELILLVGLFIWWRRKYAGESH